MQLGQKFEEGTNREADFKFVKMEVTGDSDKGFLWKRGLKGRLELVDK